CARSGSNYLYFDVW
nr:immunoglobulin heavy chain junction region [Mus musculus]